jgi:RecA/RadA recombinase
MSDEFLGQMMKAAENEAAVIAEDGTIGDIENYIDSGSYALNALLSGSIYGGWPGNRISALAGAEGTGKTFAVISAIRAFLDSNKDAHVIMFETEGAVSKKQLVSQGVDVSRVAYLPVSVIEDFKVQVNKILDHYKGMKEADRQPLLIVLDSLGMMTTRKEADDSLSGKDKKDMTRPGAIRSVFRTISLRACELNIPILVTNHTYQVVGSYFPMKEMAGGGGLKYAASMIVYLSKAKEKDKDKKVVGAIVTAKLAKGRLTKEEKVIKTIISFETGLNRYEGLLPIADQYGIVTKQGNKWVFPGQNPAFENAIKKNPQKYYTDEVLKLIDEACGKEFLFGSTLDDGDEVKDLTEDLTQVE